MSLLHQTNQGASSSSGSSLLEGKRLGRDGELDEPIHHGQNAQREEEPGSGNAALSKTVGKYRILGPLGSGSHGVVHRAIDDQTGRHVALKTVRSSSPAWLESIRREIRVLNRISHPGIVRIVDDGVDDGRPWYAMELLEGETLRRFGQRIWKPFEKGIARPDQDLTSTEPFEVQAGDPSEHERKSIPSTVEVDTLPNAAAGQLSLILKTARRLCTGLAFLHGEGLINCDLKPENVLIVGDWPVIIDFGLAMTYPGSRSRESIESARTLAGTLPYMSPEQIRGELVDARTDLYALGCLLYELVVGVPPFVGTPRSVAAQHLDQVPTPPSERVVGVPQALDEIILKLLAKDQRDRFGHAEEVGGRLARLYGDQPTLPEAPAARAYLYRPRFVGRDQVFARLTNLRDRAIMGSGAFVLVHGQSGIGKTRLAMELTRVAYGTRVEVISSEASPFATDSPETVGSAPLHTVKPLLLAVADHCQAGGTQVFERLLGRRHAVLAQLEPSLADLAGAPAEPPAPLMDPGASRRRLFRYLAETLEAFCREQPVVWIIDDLGWADELSLQFLQSLSPEYLARNRLFILATCRDDVESPGTDVLKLPHVLDVALPRLESEALTSMIRDMLALNDPSPDLVRFVVDQSEGNPFYVSEWLHAAVGQGVLHRDGETRWQLLGGVDMGPDYGVLPLPRSLRNLIEHRLADLGPVARLVTSAAAVVGREGPRDVIRQVAGLESTAWNDALDELLRRHVLEPSQVANLRFAHDKLREVSYEQTPVVDLVMLHERAGDALERVWSDHPDANQVWATLGHHFALGRNHRRAARYLRLAAENARNIYANGEAISLCNQAIAEMEACTTESGLSREELDQELATLQEMLGDLLHLTGERERARVTYEEARPKFDQLPAHCRARLFRKIGKTWEVDHRHELALAKYAEAQAVLSPNPEAASAEERDEWIQVMIDQLWVRYWLSQVPEMNSLTRVLHPVIERFGSPVQRSKFFDTQMKRNFRRDRFAIREETLSFAQAAVRACQAPGGQSDLPLVKFNLGFTLLFQGSLADGMREIQEALALAIQHGDVSLQVRCYAYLAAGARMQRNDDETRRYNERAMVQASSSNMQEYVAAAHGHAAWLHLRVGRLAEAREQGELALKIWKNLTLVFPFQRWAAIPLLEVCVSTGDFSAARPCVELLVSPKQQWLPGPAMDALSRAHQVWDGDDQSSVHQHLRRALNHLRSSDFY